MKRLVIGVIIVGILGVAAAAGIYLWLHSQTLPVNTQDTSPHTVVIETGESGASVIADLQEQQLIRSTSTARLLLRIKGNSLKPGTYTVTPAMSLLEIFSVFSEGPKDIRVTLPEGWRREQMAVRLEAALKPHASPFSAREFMDLTASLEGQLFPETYDFPPTATTQEVITRLVATGVERTGVSATSTHTINSDGTELQLTGIEVLTMASLVEREAKADVDRPIVSGILLRRMEADWPLQVDATVQYAVDTAKCRANPFACEWWKPIYDTTFTSPYNTYQIQGLPPAPIANPGKKAIESVLKPDSTPYWYYLTGNDGVMYYSKTLEEHNSSVDKHLKP